MKYLFSTLILLLGLTTLNAQSLDEELGFIYVKADYLLETNRYEEAIQEFNKIVEKDPTYKDALFKRAKAKYSIGAFKGTKKDLLQAFDVVGITPESVRLYGKTLKNLDQDEAATTTLATADMLEGRSSYPQKNENSNTDTAEEPNEEKGELEKLEDKLSSILDDLLPELKGNENEESTKGEGEEGGNSETSGDSDRESGGWTDIEINKDGDAETSDNNEDRPTQKKEEVNMVAVNEIFVDSDLTIIVKDGLGARKITNQPNILILSDASGEVVVDVIVSGRGKVLDAEFNKDASTISAPSLISLAVRKSKEFEFASSGMDEMTGTFVFKITGS